MTDKLSPARMNLFDSFAPFAADSSWMLLLWTPLAGSIVFAAAEKVSMPAVSGSAGPDWPAGGASTLVVSVAIAGAACGLLWLGARRRMRRKLGGIERRQALERERARIAKDIHDELGSSLTRILMLSQSARGELENPSRIAGYLDQIYTTARELTRDMGEIVWAVNPQHDTLDSLATYAQKFAYSFLQTANLKCRLDMPLNLPVWPLPAEIRHNLFLAFKEALNNVAKHASASEVHIILKLEPSAFALIVEDNGCGFDPKRDKATAPSGESGNGLPNMARRLEEVGGRCEISSAAGSGTRIKFVVPLKAASGW